MDYDWVFAPHYLAGRIHWTRTERHCQPQMARSRQSRVVLILQHPIYTIPVNGYQIVFVLVPHWDAHIAALVYTYALLALRIVKVLLSVCTDHSGKKVHRVVITILSVSVADYPQQCRAVSAGRCFVKVMLSGMVVRVLSRCLPPSLLLLWRRLPGSCLCAASLCFLGRRTAHALCDLRVTLWHIHVLQVCNQGVKPCAGPCEDRHSKAPWYI